MTTSSQNDIDMDALGQSAIDILQTLLRFDTTNPPGNETVAANWVAERCRAAAFETEVVESAPGRGNLVARLRSPSPAARPLMLTGHLDVVSVERDRWQRDPFGGDLVDGYLWGRGALDMKSQVAAELAVGLALAEHHVTLDRDLILAFFADEEAGGDQGAGWLWQNRPELLDAEYAINEGGGEALTINGQTFYLCQTGEKGASRLRITASAAPGHASVPLDDTAMARMAVALSRLTAWTSPTVLTEPVRAMLAAVAPSINGPGRQRIEALLESDDAAPTWEEIAGYGLPFSDETMAMLRATTRDTAVPTIIHGGHRINVIPSDVVLDVDGRILPGTDPEEWRNRVQNVVGDDVTVELVSREEGIVAEPSSPFFDAIAATIDAIDPGARIAPFLVSGGTDARNIPGVKVYGFFPFPPGDRMAEYGPLVHGHNEHIHVDDLAFGARFLHDLVVRFAGP